MKSCRYFDGISILMESKAQLQMTGRLRTLFHSNSPINRSPLALVTFKILSLSKVTVLI